MQSFNNNLQECLNHLNGLFQNNLDPRFVEFGEFVKHRLYDPVIYLRNFEHDLPKETTNIAKRAALIALPFLSLYKPLGLTLSLSMGGARVFTHLTGSVKSALNKDALGTATHLNQTALSIISVASTLFHFQTGLLITSFADAATSLGEVTTHLYAKDYPKAFEALIQASASTLYLSFMLSGTLEVMLASVLLQVSISLYQAAFELKEGRYPEALAKIAMGALRFNQAHGQYQQIQKRNAFLKLEKFSNLVEKIKKGREAAHLIDSPLHEKKETVVMIDANGKEYNFGTHYHGTGKGLVKGMNLQFRTTQIDGKNMKDIDFKVNHAFRSKLQGIVEGMKSFTPEETRDFLTLTQSHAKGIKFEQVPFQYCEETNKIIGEAYKVTLEGLGTVFIGASTDMAPIHDTVRVQIDEDKSIYELHEMLSFFNLDDAVRQSSADDVERLKIGHLFRIFYPKEATQLERNSKFYELPLDVFKAEIIQKVPKMQETLDSYLDKMETREILPGRLRYALPDISKMAYNLGARSLISTITGTKGSFHEACLRVASMIKMGMNSSEVRYRNGMTQGGLSPSYDFMTGGSDGVYTQLLTEENFKEKMNLNELAYHGDVRILFSLDALNTGTYQYHDDNYGTRTLDNPYWNPYATRPSIFNFAREEQNDWNSGNEVIIKERVDLTKLMTGIVVSNKSQRQYMVNVLREQGLVTTINGVETICNIPVSKCIQATTTLSSKLLV